MLLTPGLTRQLAHQDGVVVLHRLLDADVGEHAAVLVPAGELGAAHDLVLVVVVDRVLGLVGALGELQAGLVLHAVGPAIDAPDLDMLAALGGGTHRVASHLVERRRTLQDSGEQHDDRVGAGGLLGTVGRPPTLVRDPVAPGCVRGGAREHLHVQTHDAGEHVGLRRRGDDRRLGALVGDRDRERRGRAGREACGGRRECEREGEGARAPPECRHWRTPPGSRPGALADSAAAPRGRSRPYQNQNRLCFSFTDRARTVRCTGVGAHLLSDR